MQSLSAKAGRVIARVAGLLEGSQARRQSQAEIESALDAWVRHTQAVARNRGE